jgi:hypothetical protein
MGNMSYCRYENTAKDLMDCVNALWRADVDEPLSSAYEYHGLARLLANAKEIVELEDKINEILENDDE